MIWRILGEAFRRRKVKVGLSLLALGVGTSLAVALLGTLMNIEERLALELRSYGANLLVTSKEQGPAIEVAGVRIAPPGQGDYLDENDLISLKTIFWRNNILGFAPFLSGPAQAGAEQQPVILTGTWFERDIRLAKGTPIRTQFSASQPLPQDISVKAGVKPISSWWQVEGAWPQEGDGQAALVGARVADRMALAPGQTFTVRARGRTKDLQVSGILHTGGLEEDQVYVGLPVAQGLLGISKGMDRAAVSALTQPRSKLPANIRDKKPEDMTPKEYELWYCTPIVESIAKQIEEAIPGAVAKPVRQISEGEGLFADKMKLLVLLITAISLLGSALAVAASMSASVLERRGEIGLMKAMGADNLQVATLFLAEAAALGFLGGVVGYGLGWTGARLLVSSLFGAVVTLDLSMLALAMVLAVGTALVGAFLPIRQALRQPPVQLLARRGL